MPCRQVVRDFRQTVLEILINLSVVWDRQNKRSQYLSVTWNDGTFFPG